MKNQIIIFGLYPCQNALKNHYRKKVELYISKDKVTNYKHLIVENEKKIKINIVEKNYFKKLLPKDSLHQGIALLAETIENISIEKFLNIMETKTHSLIMIFDQLQDPHNVGAIIRSAVAFDATAIIMPKNHSPQENATIAKSASGGMDLIPIIRVTNIATTMEKLKKYGFWIYGLNARSEEKIHLIKFHTKSIIVIGTEHSGIRKLVQEKCDFMISIPNSNKIDSLNASNAAAIAMYNYYICHKI